MGRFDTLNKGFLKYLTTVFPLNASILDCSSGFVCVLFMKVFPCVRLFKPKTHKSGMRGITQKIHSAGYTIPVWKVLYPIERGSPQ